MDKEFQQIYFSHRSEWRKWLEQHHDKSTGIFFIYYKKHTLKPSIPYNEAVEEALCFGWIDSIVKRIDDERYMQKFTPRNEKSLWSDLNKERVNKMIDQKKMTEAGLLKITAAKENGKWFEITNAKKTFFLSKPLLEILESDKKANLTFTKLSATRKKYYIQWIMSAKKPETQNRRLLQMIEILKDPNNKPPKF